MMMHPEHGIVDESNMDSELEDKESRRVVRAKESKPWGKYWRAHSLTRSLAPENTEDPNLVASAKKSRVATLDVFRGLTVALMVLVDDAGYWWPKIAHAPWNGCTLADFVMPFFLFIVGVAIALAFKRVVLKRASMVRVILRAIKLIILGILLQGGFLHGSDQLSYGVDMKLIRWAGILQRIALAYLFVALVEIAITNAEGLVLPEGRFGIFKLYRWHWVAALFILIIYHSVVYGVFVPDWHFVPGNGSGAKALTVKCGVRAHFGPACNAVGYIDRTILGKHHLYWHPAWRRSKWCSLFSPDTGPAPPNAPTWCFGPFEPEGIMSSISAILSCIIGIHYGHVLTHFKDHFNRLLHWAMPGVLFIVMGAVLHISNAIPLNKQLYSFSYVCFTAGTAGLVFSALYILIHWVKKHIFFNVWNSQRVAGLLYVLFGEILFWGIVSGLLHSQRWYWKL
ncbi:hypothetical protein O6H91_12G040100 [Diphasiastrum complanatum]|uniref:Uncharacterized protein n=1 Tax=Diphasiastrum complanatum TaxID=34168 RepID=A0ACC2C0S5_DIPCM|nr:hypothetical protein O6H91_12G040100 [Diphasiastrum complanatum]